MIIPDLLRSVRAAAPGVVAMSVMMLRTVQYCM
jgi:hypothetical protein